MDRLFSGFFHYNWLEDSNENQFTLKFKRVESEEIEPILHTEITETSDYWLSNLGKRSC